jgi:DNA-binding transcriptional LysR family regulator
MDLVHLETFVAVAETGGITNAATALLRAPSNVSTRIQQLEREVGAQLLNRDKRQSSLSSDGETFLDYARTILALVEEAKGFARTDSPSGRFRLGALESTAAVRIPALLASYHLKYPQVDVELEAGSSGVLFDAVLNGHLTAAFSDGEPASHQLTGVPVYHERLVIVSPPAIDVTTDAFRRSNPTVFFFGTACSYRHRFEEWLATEGITPGRVVEISSYYSMLACATAGAGISMMPRSLLDSLPGAASVRAHDIIGSLGEAQTWLMWRRDCRSPALRALVELASGTDC